MHCCHSDQKVQCCRKLQQLRDPQSNIIKVYIRWSLPPDTHLQLKNALHGIFCHISDNILNRSPTHTYSILPPTLTPSFASMDTFVPITIDNSSSHIALSADNDDSVLVDSDQGYNGFFCVISWDEGWPVSHVLVPPIACGYVVVPFYIFKHMLIDCQVFINLCAVLCGETDTS